MTNAPNQAARPMPRAGSITIAAIERVWEAIQSRFPEVPNVVVISGGGLDARKNLIKWGHFHADQWDTAGGRAHELLVSGECLSRDPRYILETILHEAAHAVAHERGVKDTSRRGRYHNKRFVAIAEELGLVWPEGQAPDAGIGYSAVKLPDEAAETWADALAALDEGRAAWRSIVTDEVVAEAPRRKSKNRRPKAVCGCSDERPIWLSWRVLEAQTVACAACGEVYRAADGEDLNE